MVTRYSTPTQDEKYYADVRAWAWDGEIASFCTSRVIKAAVVSHGMDNLGTLDTPDYIWFKGWYDMQLRCEDPTNTNILKRYRR